MDRDEALATIDAARASGEHVADDVYKAAYASEASAQPEAAASATTTGASELTPDAARAQIPAILDQLYKATPGSPEYVALDQRRNALYQAAYAEPASSPPAANEFTSLTPSERTARIGAIRDLMGQYNPGSLEHQLLQDDLDACYQAAETAPGDDKSAAPFALPALPSELSDRQYDEGVLRELGTLVAAAPADYGMTEVLPTFAARGNRYLATGTRPDPDQTDAALERLWGAEADARLEAARSELDRQLRALTPASRDKVRAYLDETGLSDDVVLIEFFWERASRRRPA